MPKKSKTKKFKALKAAKMHEVVMSRKQNLQQGNDVAVQVVPETKRFECPDEKSEEISTVPGVQSREAVSFSNSEENADVIPLQVDHTESSKEAVIEGRRIINLKTFYNKLKEVATHGPMNCGLGCVDIISEKITGLDSILTLQCKLCNMKFYVSSDEESDMNINNSAVLGTLAIGCGYSQLQELSATLDLPLMGLPLYQKCHASVAKMWNHISMTTMKNAGDEEREAAIAEGRTDSNGIPIIDVIVDGCWSKRSYKKNYSALSGAAAIIGKRTGKVLYIGVKNKYCCICALAEYKNTSPREHTCFKNYSGPSTGMESTILVEGFKCSIEMHGLIYARMISDGDSATYSKLVEARPYSNVTIQKIECKNHVMRNLCNKITQLKTDTKYPIRFRKYITDKKVIIIRSTIKKAMEKYTSNSEAEKRVHVEYLYNDILLAHSHAFDDHSRCKQYFCNKVGEDTSDHDFKTSSLWSKICQIISYVSAHAPSLVHNVESNRSENFNSIIAKLVGGKRINFSLKGSYENRCKGAVISHNTRALLSTTIKRASGRSPRGNIKILERRRLTKKNLRKYYKKKNKLKLLRGEDVNYGENCAREDINPVMMEKNKKTFLENLKKTKEEREHIEKETILQSASSEWLELRRNLLTASNFGKIIKRREDISCRNLVKDLLYKNCISHIKSIQHGNDNEKMAIEQLSKETMVQIEPCGLFIDEKLSYLGATPDGICKDNNMIVEIKCPVSAYKTSFEDAIREKKVPFYKFKDNIIQINKNHNWYYQIQGQLHIAKKTKCLFGLWLGENIPMKTDIIERDDKFWNEKMEPKLTKFYLHCVLPELIDPRFTRKMSIRDPPYIKEAIEAKTTKKSVPKKRKAEKEKKDVNENKGKENREVSTNQPGCSTTLIKFNDDTDRHMRWLADSDDDEETPEKRKYVMNERQLNIKEF